MEFKSQNNCCCWRVSVAEAPIAMVLLSRLLPYGANRWANIIAAGITLAFEINNGITDFRRYLSHGHRNCRSADCPSLFGRHGGGDTHIALKRYSTSQEA